MVQEAKIAKRVRMYRERLNMSTADLADKSGISEAVIISIEKGEVLPALGVLTKISRALGQRLGTFMDDQFKPDPIISRADEIASLRVKKAEHTDSGYTYYSLALGKPDRHMDPFIVELAANVPEKPSSHEGEELIICINGEVDLHYGLETFVLHPGDTAYYNSVVKHSLVARGDKSASIYGIVFTPA